MRRLWRKFPELIPFPPLDAGPADHPARIVVIGHSLGGTLIPRIGAADGKIAALISMAGATRQLEHAMLEQAQCWRQPAREMIS